MRPCGTVMCRRRTYGRQRRGDIGDPWGVPTETGERMLGESWKTSVQVLANKKAETQATMWEGTREARSLALRVETSTLSKPLLISRKRVETFNQGLRRVLTSWVRVRQALEELSPWREPYWFG